MRDPRFSDHSTRMFAHLQNGTLEVGVMRASCSLSSWKEERGQRGGTLRVATVPWPTPHHLFPALIKADPLACAPPHSCLAQ